MAITNGYGTLAGYKLRFWKGDVNDVTDDKILEPTLEAVSRLIDNMTYRKFYATTETRYYTPESGTLIFIDDLLSVTSLKTDGDGDRTYENTWDTGDYDLMPFNAALDIAPYTWIELAVLGDYIFPTMPASVELAGSFGYCASTDQPVEITEALYFGAHRIMKRLVTPLGVSAKPQLGQLKVMVDELRHDPDFLAWIDPYIKRT
jgi:hypothetical protein